MTINFNNIGLSEECMKFIRERLKSEDYRGWHHSQHNRYTFEDVVKIFDILYEFIREEFLIIRTTDYSKRRGNCPDEKLYSEVCTKIREIIGKGTQDSIRKNFFVDFHRMKLLERYDKEGKIIEREKKARIHKIKISELGLKLTNTSNGFGKHYVYLKGVDFLFGNEIISLLRRIMKRLENNLRADEFQFFVSFLDKKRNYKEETIINFCLDYRKKDKEGREKKFKKRIKEHCDSTKELSKKDKRDFHNWKNGAGQSLYLLGTTIYFEFDKRGKRLLLKIKEEKGYERSSIERKNYFKEHSISSKLKGRKFQIHHIIPLYMCEKDRNKLKLIDKGKNMIYMKASKHQELNREQKRGFIILSGRENNDLVLSNILDKEEKMILKNSEEFSGNFLVPETKIKLFRIF